MIKPNKYLDLNLSVLRISSIIIRELKKHRMINYVDLLQYLIKKEGDSIKEVYIPSLTFLYLLNKIEYHPKTDCLEIKNEIK